MLVFADQLGWQDPRLMLDRLAEGLRESAGMPPGIERHGTLVTALVEAGELAQGLADAAFAAQGSETRTPAERAAMVLLGRIAAAVRVSWDTGFRAIGGIASAPVAVLRRRRMPERIKAKRAEGFAHYALYPEAYREAVRTAGLAAPVRVTGIRSIGAPLAAVVADALGAPMPGTIRPVPTQHARKVVASPAFTAELLAGGAEWHALVDEGPGWSGSSFGAVADFLEDRGVPSDRIRFFPSHGGPLAKRALRRHRRRWHGAVRHTVELADLVIHRPRRPEHRLEAWVADLVGWPEGPMQDLSAGAWRALRYPDERRWPPSLGHNERRKHLVRSRGQTWLLKFAGLGRAGPQALERARALHLAGFSPEVAGLCHGFLLERWLEDGTPLPLATVDRDRLVAQLGRYLAFRASRFTTGADRGASLVRLWEMARFNLAQGLGRSFARTLDAWRPALARLERRVRPVATDNRLQAWEWLVMPDGRLLKTDAVDHHAGWDLIGCQDIGWDLVGAGVELGLDEAERRRLIAVVEQETGRSVDATLLAFLTPCYLAFQLGVATLAADIAEDQPAEAGRWRQEMGRYGAHLRAALEAA